MIRFRTTIFALGGMLLIPSIAAAQPAAKVPPHVASVLACQAEKDEKLRLVCYDKAATSLASASQAGTIVVLDREEIRNTRRSLFGFNLPRLPFFRGDDGEDKAQEEILAKVQSAQDVEYGKWRIVLNDGAVWQTTEPEGRLFPPRLGQDVRIKRGALGSFMLSVNGQRSVRAMRVR